MSIFYSATEFALTCQLLYLLSGRLQEGQDNADTLVRTQLLRNVSARSNRPSYQRRSSNASAMLLPTHPKFNHQERLDQGRAATVHEKRSTVQHTMGVSSLLYKPSLRGIYTQTEQNRPKASFRSRLPHVQDKSMFDMQKRSPCFRPRLSCGLGARCRSSDGREIWLATMLQVQESG